MSNISPREEVRQDVINQLKDMRRDQPLVHRITYDEIIELVTKANLSRVADFARDY